ncbi:MAG: RNA-guided endonuclease InsQ/TnpB family protein, partial [Microcystaceae cyanobacterium]
HSVIRLEDLNVKGMMQNGKLSAAITDQGFGEFRRQVVYKTSACGGRVELVDRFYPSSKKCSSCGFVKLSLTLSERVYHCENCGHTQDRDENAAANLCYAPNEKVRLAQPEQSDT